MEKLLEQIREFYERHQQLVWLGGGLIIVLAFVVMRPQANQSLGQQSTSVSQVVATSSTPPAGQTSSSIQVDVKGAVNKAGVYTFKRGTRVDEAIKKAGGLAAGADLSSVNLAKQVADQELLYIPREGEKSPVATGTNAVEEASAGTPVNLNSATKEELMTVSGIGDKKADKIIAYRDEHGSFNSVDDLKNVNGFGEKTVAALKDKLSV